MRKTAQVAFVALLLSVVLATSARVESLSDALIAAYRHSGLLEQNRALLRAADEDVAQSIAALRPVLGYALGANYSSATSSATANLQLTASMLLDDFGRSHLRTDVAEENVLALREALIGVEQAVLLRALVAYVGVQRDAAIVALRENNVRLFTQELRAANDRFDVGEVTRTDVAIAEARLASAQSRRAAASGAHAMAREEYRVATGHYPGALAPTPALPATADGLASARTLARQKHPDMLQAQRSVKIAELNIAIAAGAIKPSLSGRAAVSVDQNGAETGSFGLTLSGPIYQGGGLASVHRQAAARRDATRAALHMARLAVDQNVGNAWSQLVVAKAELQATEQQIRAARVAFRGVREEARLGARTTLDVLNAEQELLDAQASKISAQTDRYVAVYKLLAAMGLLTVDHLRLGIATYDPAAYYDAVKSAPTYGVSPQGQKLDSVLKALGKN
ncbi:TolC family outer membrane protein [Rhodobacteraceae bacterium R_SAG10]|nr:TolC family outer membrane protein [Rhodobacteraceae bacterium R_SAG10]